MDIRHAQRIKTFAGPGMSGHNNRILIGDSQCIERGHQVTQIFGGVNVLLPVRADDKKLATLETEALNDISAITMIGA